MFAKFKEMLTLIRRSHYFANGAEEKEFHTYETMCAFVYA